MKYQIINRIPENLVNLKRLKEDYVAVDFKEHDDLLCKLYQQSVEFAEGKVRFPVHKSDTAITLNAAGSCYGDIDSINNYFSFQKMKVNDPDNMVITKFNLAGDEITLVEGTNYRFDSEANRIYWIGGIENAENGYEFIKIVVNIGWDCTDIPADLETALMDITSLYYDSRGADISYPRKAMSALSRYAWYH